MKTIWKCRIRKTAICITLLLIWPDTGSFAQTWDTQLDSTFVPYSLPQLQNFRNYYTQEQDRLQQEKMDLIKRGIEDGELQLASRPDPKILDQILVRLADLYYYREKDDYISRMDEYDKLLEAYDEGTLQSLPEEPRMDFQKSLNIYQRIIDEFPKSELIDDAVYNKGFLLEEMGERQQAVQVYLYFVEAYPSSKFIPDAYMRLGEYYFDPPLNQLNKAILCYKEVTQYRSHARYEEALYKLGWSYYRLSEYPEAISYFTSLVENLYAQKTHLAPRDLRTDLLEEAIDYIAISFIDYGGPGKTYQYLKKLNMPEWSAEVLRRMGNTYKEQKEEYDLAIQTYNYFLEILGNDIEALFVHKAIVDCYIALNNKEQTFTSRQNIYEQFQPRSAWWESLEDEKTKLEAYRISENAMRNNFNYLLQKITETPSETGFKSVVQLGYQYLDIFPEDNYAYMIRWNVALILDTKLHQYKEALQEYLTISLVYCTETYDEFAREKGLSSIRDAAQNAIVIADTLIEQEKRITPQQPQGGGTSEGEFKTLIPLSEAQKWQAMAYDNFIKLFPFDEKTPTILSNAGALYYINNQFDTAIKYFKTLIRYFPDHEAAKQVELSILESYFAKNDFESTEALAKKILGGPYTSDIKLKARQRLGEAIFLRAQGMADTGQGVKAADEFYRLAVEVPQISFADRALFNSAAEYEKLHDYESAIRAYEMLRGSYGTSTLLTDALNNLAFDYGEVGKSRQAADRYQELSGLLQDPVKSQDALHNAYILYKKGRHLAQAIEVTITFLKRFPSAPEAETMYFEAADLWGQLQQKTRKTQHLLSFMQRFPNSPRCIEASFRIGEYYQNADSLSIAEKYYAQAYSYWQNLPPDTAQSYSFLATEGLFNAARMAHRRYENIVLDGSPAQLNAQILKKENQLKALENQYAKIVSMKTIRLPESLYRIAELYDQFAVAWAKQPISEKDVTARAIKEKQINQKAATIFGQAIDAYLLASRGLRQILDEQNGKPLETSAQPDSLVDLTKMWKDRSDIKISGTLYRTAQIHQESIDRLLAVPVPGGMGVLEQLEYKSQILLQAILPLVDDVIDAHKRNLQVSDSLSLHNSWTQASQKQIFIYLSLVSGQYESLTYEALNMFKKQIASYRYNTLEKKRPLDQKYYDQMMNLLEQSKTFALSAVTLRKKGMQRTETLNIDMLPAAANREAMDHFALNLSDSVSILISDCRQDQKRANAFLNTTQDIYYEDLLTNFEDNEYYLNQARIAALEAAFETEPGFHYQRPTRNDLAGALLRIDPDTYSQKLGIQLAITHLATDTTWTCSFQPMPVTLKKTAEEAREVHPYGKVIRDSSMSGPPVYQIWVAPSGKVSMLAFRKETRIAGSPVMAKVRLVSESPCRIYVNGNVAVDRAQKGDYDVTQYIQSGVNQLGFVYVDQPIYSVRGLLTVRYVPKTL
jgi:tetratricopeptide (TPR) repeat protein